MATPGVGPLSGHTGFAFATRGTTNAGLLQIHPARVACLLAYAHDIEASEFRDFADVSCRRGLTRACMTQVMSFLLLAPDIRIEVAALASGLAASGSLCVTNVRCYAAPSGASNEREDKHQATSPDNSRTFAA